MGFINKVSLLGRLGRDPELTYSQNNMAVCRVSLATNNTFMKNGKRETEVEWHNIVAFGKRAETMAEYLTKGREVYFEGQKRTRSYKDKAGVERERCEIIVHDVQFVGPKPEGVKTKSGTKAGTAGTETEDLGNVPELPPDADELLANSVHGTSAPAPTGEEDAKF